MGWNTMNTMNTIKDSVFYSSGLIRLSKDEFVNADEIKHNCNCAVFTMNELFQIQGNNFLLKNGIFPVDFEYSTRFILNPEERKWLLSKAKMAFDKCHENIGDLVIVESMVYVCPIGVNISHNVNSAFILKVKENNIEFFYFGDTVIHDGNENSLYFVFQLEEKKIENNIEIWKKLTSGKFWASGGMRYEPNLKKFIEFQPLSWEEINQKGCAVVGDVEKTTYFGGHWNGMELANKKKEYEETSFKQFRLTPSIAQCLNFLEEKEKSFIMKAFVKGIAFFEKNCLDLINLTVILCKPNQSVAMHTHYAEQTDTLTYVFSSKTSVGKRAALVVETSPGNYIEKEYPDCNEFFFLLSSDLVHGVYSGGENDNYYLYFIFDGVKLRSDIQYEYNKFYRVK